MKNKGSFICSTRYQLIDSLTLKLQDKARNVLFSYLTNIPHNLFACSSDDEQTTLIDFLTSRLAPENLQFSTWHFSSKTQEIRFEPNHAYSIYGSILEHIRHHHIVPCFHSGYPKKILFIPPKLWHVLLTYRFGKNTIQPLLALGYSDKETFSDPTKRVVGITGRFAPGPSKIHGTIANSIELYIHDQYHHLVEASNPHRILWINLAKNIALQARLLSCDTVSSNFRKLSTLLLDRDVPSYLHHQLIAKTNEAFWASLGMFLQRTNCKKCTQACADHIAHTEDFATHGISKDSLAEVIMMAPSFTQRNTAHPRQQACIMLHYLFGYLHSPHESDE